MCSKIYAQAFPLQVVDCSSTLCDHQTPAHKVANMTQIQPLVSIASLLCTCVLLAAVPKRTQPSAAWRYLNSLSANSAKWPHHIPVLIAVLRQRLHCVLNSTAKRLTCSKCQSLRHSPATGRSVNLAALCDMTNGIMGKMPYHYPANKCKHILQSHGRQKWPDGQQCQQSSKRLRQSLHVQPRHMVSKQQWQRTPQAYIANHKRQTSDFTCFIYSSRQDMLMLCFWFDPPGRGTQYCSQVMSQHDNKHHKAF